MVRVAGRSRHGPSCSCATAYRAAGPQDVATPLPPRAGAVAVSRPQPTGRKIGFQDENGFRHGPDDGGQVGAPTARRPIGQTVQLPILRRPARSSFAGTEVRRRLQTRTTRRRRRTDCLGERPLGPVEKHSAPIPSETASRDRRAKRPLPGTANRASGTGRGRVWLQRGAAADHRLRLLRDHAARRAVLERVTGTGVEPAAAAGASSPLPTRFNGLRAVDRYDRRRGGAPLAPAGPAAVRPAWDPAG